VATSAAGTALLIAPVAEWPYPLYSALMLVAAVAALIAASNAALSSSADWSGGL